MKILIIDNYDSFTFNLYQLVGDILSGQKKKFLLHVYRNDEIKVGQILRRGYSRIIISPGPGDPSDSKYFGVCKDVLLIAGKTVPVLGVCLGMQGMAYHFGGKIVKAQKPMHGKTSFINHDGKGIFAGLPQKLEVMRYHSLIADFRSLPTALEVCARVIGTDGEIMGLRHKRYPLEGVQFHPESFATEGGRMMMENFLFNYLTRSLS